jgi:hypothetical protein
MDVGDFGSRSWLVWGLEGDGAAGEHHESEGGFGAVEPVGAAGDEPDLVVERLGAALVDPEADRLEDPVAVAADRLAESHERLQPAAGGFADEPVDQDRHIFDSQAWREDRFLEGVGAPHLATGPAQRRGLVVGEVLRPPSAATSARL